MRYLILFFSLFIYLSNAYGQTYVPLKTSSASWNTRLWSIWPGGESINTKGYRIAADTIIGGNMYQALSEFNIGTGVDVGIVGAIREDSLRRVWLRSNNSQIECSAGSSDTSDLLLWSFNNHGIGDSIEVINYVGWGDRWAVVQHIDSILIGGVYRLKYDVNYVGSAVPNDPDYWISGIGPANGLMSAHLEVLECLPDITCYEDDSVNWLNPIMDSCYYHSVGIDEYADASVLIYPNPVRTEFRVQSDIKFTACYLYNMAGMLVRHQQRSFSAVSVENLKPGMYIIELVNKRLTMRKKLIVE